MNYLEPQQRYCLSQSDVDPGGGDEEQGKEGPLLIWRRTHLRVRESVALNQG